MAGLRLKEKIEGQGSAGLGKPGSCLAEASRQARGLCETCAAGLRPRHNFSNRKARILHVDRQRGKRQGSQERGGQADGLAKASRQARGLCEG